MAVPRARGRQLSGGERWQRLKEAFEAAQRLAPEARDARLDEICAGDQELRREAASLLRALDAAGSFMEEPAVLGLPPATEAVLGSRLGPWRLVGEIDRGGMGAVYRAVRDDDQYQKEVAVKLLSAASAGATAARFRVERQILARLDHPNIARLLDGGASPDGRPYLVMELVRGQPIDRYCNERGLGLRARLDLFTTVCDAVQYAHQNLVIHRDIKPDNILVTDEGVPKLLDFGIAKLLEPDEGGTAVTVTELRALTPRYASPEQIRGDPVTTSSDVYSLGVLLYELLAGRPPYELLTRAPEELLHVVCHQQPERPSRAAGRGGNALSSGGSSVSPRELAGDLDWIVLNALRKEPARRYASAREMAEDLRRHLRGLPVLARPDTVRYRASKFVRRHRAAVAGAALLLLSLAGGLLVSFWQWRRAEAAHREAEQRFDDTRRLANTLLFEVHDAIENLQGATKARELIVRRAVEYLDRLASSSVDDNVKAELAGGYLRLGDVQGRAGNASLGQTTAAILSYRKAVRLAEAIGSPATAPVAYREILARAYRRLADALWQTGEVKPSGELLARAVSILEDILAKDPGNPQLITGLAGARFEEARALAAAGMWEDTLAAYGRAATLYEALAKALPANANRQRNVALMYKYMGGTLERLGRPAEARGLYEKAVLIDRGTLAAQPDSASARLDLSYDLASLAKRDAADGRPGPAIRGMREALALREAVLSADPVNAQARTTVARALGDIAAFLYRQGDSRAAEAEMRRSVGERERLAAGAPGGLEPPLLLSQALVTLGDMILLTPAGSEPSLQALRGPRGREACALYRRSRGLFAGIAERLPPSEQTLRQTLSRRLTGCAAAGRGSNRARLPTGTASRTVETLDAADPYARVALGSGRAAANPSVPGSGRPSGRSCAVRCRP